MEKSSSILASFISDTPQRQAIALDLLEFLKPLEGRTKEETRMYLKELAVQHRCHVVTCQLVLKELKTKEIVRYIKPKYTINTDFIHKLIEEWITLLRS